MKETLIADGWVCKGGCKCNGGADFYSNEKYSLLTIEDFYKGHFWVLKKNHKRLKKGTYNEVEKLLEEIRVGNF